MDAVPPSPRGTDAAQYRSNSAEQVTLLPVSRIWTGLPTSAAVGKLPSSAWAGPLVRTGASQESCVERGPVLGRDPDRRPGGVHAGPEVVPVPAGPGAGHRSGTRHDGPVRLQGPGRVRGRLPGHPTARVDR